MSGSSTVPVTAAASSGRPPGRSPLRLMIVFVAALGIVLGVVGAAVIALTPPPPAPDCPESDGVCGRPPPDPTLPPTTIVAGSPPATRAPAAPAPATPAATATAAPPPQATPATPAPATPVPTPATVPPATVPPATVPPATVPPATVPPATEPPASPGNGFVVPAPRRASGAAPYRSGTPWQSPAYGFSLEFDDAIWNLARENERGLQLTAGRGNVSLSIIAYPAAERSPQAVFREERERLEGVILGLTEETDPALQLPGVPNIGYRAGVGGAFAGTVNTPQGPTVNVSAAILAAGDERITVVVTLLAVSQLRPAAFSVTDSLLNTFRWSDDGL